MACHHTEHSKPFFESIHIFNHLEGTWHENYLQGISKLVWFSNLSKGTVQIWAHTPKRVGGSTPNVRKAWDEGGRVNTKRENFFLTFFFIFFWGSFSDTCSNELKNYNCQYHEFKYVIMSILLIENSLHSGFLSILDYPKQNWISVLILRCCS